MAQRSNHPDPIGPFHIVARSINREWFTIPIEDVWEVFCNQLFFLKHAFDFEIHAFVLMNNHYHLIASTPYANLSEGMAYFHREVSKELNRRGNRINRTFAGRFFRCHLGSHHYYLHCYKYIYRNPVRAGLVVNCEEYRYSSLIGLLGGSKVTIPIAEDIILFGEGISSTLDWLNSTPDSEDIESIRVALCKGNFKLPKDRSSRKRNRLEESLL